MHFAWYRANNYPVRKKQEKWMNNMFSWQAGNAAHDTKTWRYQCITNHCLTHWGRAMYICVSELGHHWFRWWLVACLVPSHYLNQCWVIVIWTIRNEIQWDINRNSNIFMQENAFENVIWKMAAIKSWPQCVKTHYTFLIYSCIFPWILGRCFYI